MEEIVSDGTFIAYKGTEITREKISDALKRICPYNCEVYDIYDSFDNYLFAKIIDGEDDYYSKYRPYYDFESSSYTVYAYKYNESKSPIDNYNECIYEIKYLCRFLRLNGHKMVMGKAMDLCYVTYRPNITRAGVTGNMHLYYGYTKENREPMFSNDKEMLKQFCDQISEIPHGNYIENGVLYNFYGELVKDDPTLLVSTNGIKYPYQVDRLNEALAKVEDRSLRRILVRRIEDCLKPKR